METDNQEIKYEEKYVAFLDILGFSDMILKQTKEESIKTIDRISTAFGTAKEQINEFTKKLAEKINGFSEKDKQLYSLVSILNPTDRNNPTDNKKKI